MHSSLYKIPKQTPRVRNPNSSSSLFLYSRMVTMANDHASHGSKRAKTSINDDAAAREAFKPYVRRPQIPFHIEDMGNNTKLSYTLLKLHLILNFIF